ncbi:Ran-binding protein 3 [Eumeta japonica]|uniref:Ran-binding protein 3 n=1 Tax=Eumeta variegata TaxID=151549 RepID=A0A4C1USK0_EUMVA|nr:Ran-binding protein 3 [Eumeta japonica]
MAEAKQDMNHGSTQSRVVLAKPRLGGFGSNNLNVAESSKGSTSGASLLRPAQLKPNPFLKASSENEPEDKSAGKSEVTDKEDKVEDRLKETPKENVETPKFVPLGGTSTITPRTNSSVTTSNQPASSSSGFVFGQNLSERVIFQENVNNGEASALDHSATNGTSELLFTNAVASVKDHTQDEPGPSDGGNRDGLAAAAAEYERSHARPPPPPSNYTMTGEEDEVNVLQISCRLFAWESGSWRERGRGVLRLNDASDGEASRVVARVSGSLRVVLNTKLWPAMFVERAGNKSLRITAADAQQQVKLFLVMGSPGDIAQLYRALLTRIAMLKRSASNNSNSYNLEHNSNRLEVQNRSSCVDNPANPYTYEEDESLDNDKPSENEDSENAHNVDGGEECTSSERLESRVDSPHIEFQVADSTTDDKDQNKSLKRKDSDVEDETSNKRQCSDVVIQ